MMSALTSPTWGSFVPPNIEYLPASYSCRGYVALYKIYFMEGQAYYIDLKGHRHMLRCCG
ncbi:hypothetical protein DSUL_30117 [Desulfovibrionales bacterium]